MINNVPQEPIISLKDVSLILNKRQILKDITFSIQEGEFIAVLGPNGAGKSTLLKLLLGLYSPTQGNVLVFRKSPTRGNNAIGYAPQHRTLESELALRARDIVGFGLDGNVWGIPFPDKKRDKQIEDVLQEVDMLSYADIPVGKLSGGQQQSLLIAQALLTQPKLLLLDEPLSNLDITHARSIVALVTKIAKSRKITVLFVTHDVNPLLSSIDRVLYIANKNIALGKPEDVITTKQLSALYTSQVEVVHANGRIFVIGEEV